MQTLCVGFLVSLRPISHWFQRASEHTRHLFTSFDTFQNTKIQNYFPDLFQQKWEENQCFSEPHSKISTARPAFLSEQTSAAATRRGCATWAPQTTRGLCWGHIARVPGRAERDTPRMTLYAPEPYRIHCVKPDSQGQLDGCWKNTKLVALISLLQGSVRHPPLAQFSADNF